MNDDNGTTIIRMRGLRKLRPGDCIMVTGIVDRLNKQGVIPRHVTICTIPPQFEMEVMNLEQVEDMIAYFELAREKMIKGMMDSQKEN